jgi:SCF-associated factor 1
MPLLELPEDILLIIFTFLEPKEYLAFCQATKETYAKFRQDSQYWRTETSNTFRIPISPLLAADGARWYWLYKRLKTQTRLYTWGQGVKGNLGPGRELRLAHNLPRHGPGRGRMFPRAPLRPAPAHPVPGPRPTAPAITPAQVMLRRGIIFERTSSTWPTECHTPDEVEAIADMQCGGWSTSILSAQGKVYTTGVIDSADGRIIGEATTEFRQLEYLTQSTSAVRQFSSGRRHILALTDDSKIISWDRINAKGLMVFSRSGAPFQGKPIRVAAGWAESSTYIPELGIIYWTPFENEQTDEMLDGMPVKEKVIPNTERRSEGNIMVEVSRHIVLENFIVWITTDSKVRACCTHTENPDQFAPSQAPFDVPGFSAEDREIQDIQGSFRNFGVFTKAGEVLSGNVDYLRRCEAAIRDHAELVASDDWSMLTDLLASRPRDIPALQHTGVIALAHGDYHYHALHADGRITSYGSDSQSCGSLGLGAVGTGGRFRGMYQVHPSAHADSLLRPIAQVRGREIWFEPERKDWLQWMEDELKQPFLASDGQPARTLFESEANAINHATFSEWIEQEGRHWEDGPIHPLANGVSESSTKRNSEDYANLNSYFPIAIAAAGWHSGALLLHDEEKSHEVRDKWIVRRQAHEDDMMRSMPGAFESVGPDEEYVWKHQGFPRVRLPNGVEMPGVGEARPWRDGMPTMQELGLE